MAFVSGYVPRQVVAEMTSVLDLVVGDYHARDNATDRIGGVK